VLALLARATVTEPSVDPDVSGAANLHFTQEPLEQGTVTTAVLDDTCGNLIQLATET
jgi:hypothetical protein